MDIKLEKQKLLDRLYAPYKACMMCPLGGLGRKNVVFGEGNPDAQIMLIGEAPGKQEDEKNRPFIGRSGKLLTKCLTIAGIDREEIFITNIVKCRPPNNRAPSKTESFTCKNLLLYRQIAIIQPSILCTLGSSPLSALLEEPVKMTERQGILIHKENYRIYPMFHPAYILRNPRKIDEFIQGFIKMQSLL